MTATELESGVLRRIDEIGTSNNAHNFPISEMLEDATNRLLLIAPLKLFRNPTDFGSGSISSDDINGSGSVTLPFDFIKLVSFKMQGWQRVATQAGDCYGREYEKQFNNITRGGVAKPKVFINGGKLEYFSLPIGVTHTISDAKCICKMSATSASFPELLINPLLWLTASMVFTTTNEHNASLKCLEIATNQLAELGA